MTQQAKDRPKRTVAPKANKLAQLEPVTVLGTGFLRQILQPPSTAGHQPQLNRELRPLVEWDSLLREVALSENLFSAWDPSLASRPTLQWDEMVRAKLRLPGKHPNLKQANRAETVLRGSVVKTLKHAMSNAHVDQQKLDEFRAAAGRHIVSLNFDTLIAKGEKAETGKSPEKAVRRLHLRLDSAKHTYWFPHGCVRRQASIRLGLRDYGFLPSDWNEAFRLFKAFEQRHRHGSDWTDAALAAVRQHLINEEVDRIDTLFTGQLLLAPLIFFGVGLSESEWGWWWLMNQRARNLASVQERSRPETVIVVIESDPKASFWARRPAGIAPLFVKDWDEGWAVLLGWLQHTKNG
jgi:hypothetical protein